MLGSAFKSSVNAVNLATPKKGRMRLQFPSGAIYDFPENASQATIDQTLEYDKQFVRKTEPQNTLAKAPVSPIDDVGRQLVSLATPKAPEAPQKPSKPQHQVSGLPELANRISKGEKFGPKPRFYDEVEAIIAASPRMSAQDKARLRRLASTAQELSYIAEAVPDTVPIEIKQRLVEAGPRSQERQIRESGVLIQADDPRQIGSTLSEIGGDVAQAARLPRLAGEIATYLGPGQIAHGLQAGTKLAGGELLQGGLEALGTIIPDIPLAPFVKRIQQLQATSGLKSAKAVGEVVDKISSEFRLTPEQKTAFKQWFQQEKARGLAAERQLGQAPAPKGKTVPYRDYRNVYDPNQPALPESAPRPVPPGGFNAERDAKLTAQAEREAQIAKMRGKTPVPGNVSPETQYVQQNWRKIVDGNVVEIKRMLSDPQVSQNHKRQLRGLLGKAQNAIRENKPPADVESLLRKRFQETRPTPTRPAPSSYNQGTALGQAETIKSRASQLQTEAEQKALYPAGLTEAEIKASQKKLGIQPQKENIGAQKVRSDSGQVRSEGRLGKGLQDQGGENLQRNPQTGAEAGNAKEQVAVKNAAVDAVRAKAGLQDVKHPAQSKSWDQTLAEADKGYEFNRYHKALRTLLDKAEKDKSKSLPAFNEAQQGQMFNHLGGIQKAIREKNVQIVKAESSGADASIFRKELEDLRKFEDEATKANYLVGTTTGRTLNLRKATADLDKYSPAAIENDLKATNKNVNKEYVKQGKEIGEDIGRIAAEAEAIRPKAYQEAANTFFDAVKRSRPGPKATIQTRRKAALGNIKAQSDAFLKDIRRDTNVSVGGVKIGVDAAKYLWQISPDVYQLARTYIDEGVVAFDDVVRRIRGDLAEAGVDISDEEVHRIFAGEVDRMPRTLSEVNQVMQELRRQAKGTVGAQRAQIARKLKVYEDILASKTLPKRRPSPAPYADELMAKEVQLRARKAEVDYLRELANAEKKWEELSDFAKFWHNLHNVSRAGVAGLDLSYPLNQGAFPLLAYPRATAAMMNDMRRVVSHAKSEDVRKEMFKIFGEIRKSPRYAEAVDGGLDLFKGNEIFTSGPNKLWGFSHAEAAYEVAAARQRMQMFESMADLNSKPWFGGLVKARTLDREDFGMIAEAVNTMTGVGTGTFAGFAKGANKYSPLQMFAPGYFVSRMKLGTATPLINAVWKGNNKLAGIIVRDYMAFASQVTAFMGAAKALGAEVNTDDPSSPDWFKIKYGDTTIDMSGGIVAPLRMMRMLADSDNRSKVPNAMLFTMKGKLAPVGRTVVGAIEGTSYGKSFDPSTTEGLWNIALGFAPIFSQNTKEIWESEDLTPTQKSALTILALFGGNVSIKQAPDKGR